MDSSPALRGRAGTKPVYPRLPEISGKRLEILKEVIPRLSRVVVFETSTTPGTAQSLKETELAAVAFGVKLNYLDIRAAKDIEEAFRVATKQRADAALMLDSAIFNSQRA
jgi:putative tryptophan/tyrosine transport system substrate-binding protein